MKDEKTQCLCGKRRWGCLWALAVPIVLYVALRVVPASWYMPRFRDFSIDEFCASGKWIGIHFTNTEYYYDFDRGLLALLTEGPYGITTRRDVVSVATIDQSFGVTPIFQTVEDHMGLRGVFPLTNGIAFIRKAKNSAGQICEYSKSGIHCKELKDVVWNHRLCINSSGILNTFDDNDVFRAYIRRSTRTAEDVWTPVFEKNARGGSLRLLKCGVPDSLAEMVHTCEEGKDTLQRQIFLYTFLKDGEVVTNKYGRCISDYVCEQTVLGVPDDVLLVEKRRVGRGDWSGSKLIVWNRQGVLREIDVPWKKILEGAVALHTGSDGRKHIVTLWAKKARRRSVDFRFTFVDLKSGEQMVRDVTVPVPADSKLKGTKPGPG